MTKTREFRIVIFILAILIIFNIVALYNLNYKLDDAIGAIDVLIEFKIK